MLEGTWDQILESQSAEFLPDWDENRRNPTAIERKKGSIELKPKYFFTVWIDKDVAFEGCCSQQEGMGIFFGY